MTQTAEPIEVCPLNDLNIVVGPIKSIVDGTPTPVTDGTVIGFLAKSKAPGATTADAALQKSLTHIGGEDDGEGGTYDDGTWLYQVNAADLTQELLEEHFLTNTPWFIAQRTDDVRVAKKCVYRESREAD